jgi:putative endonuclease
MNLDSRHQRGARAERAVAAWLAARGWDILGMNLRVGHLEIDLVARNGPLVAMVEVRTRGVGAYERAFASVGHVKRTRLLQAADRLWRFHLRKMPGVERMRIDVAAVTFTEDGAHVDYASGALVG